MLFVVESLIFVVTCFEPGGSLVISGTGKRFVSLRTPDADEFVALAYGVVAFLLDLIAYLDHLHLFVD